MRSKRGELLFQFGPLAGGTLGLLSTIDDGLKLLTATLAYVFENWHNDLRDTALRMGKPTPRRN